MASTWMLCLYWLALAEQGDAMYTIGGEKSSTVTPSSLPASYNNDWFGKIRLTGAIVVRMLWAQPTTL